MTNISDYQVNIPTVVEGAARFLSPWDGARNNVYSDCTVSFEVDEISGTKWCCVFMNGTRLAEVPMFRFAVSSNT